MNKLNHLAIIMDGNRRWAKQKGLPSLEGHRQGYLKLKQVGDWCIQAGIKFLTIYAFSTENWNRAPEEVNYLIKLTAKVLKEDLQEFHQKGIRLRTIGQLDRYPPELQEIIRQAEKLTKSNTQGTLISCLNYGGQTEIVDAVKKIIQQNKKPGEIDEELIKNNLYAPDVPYPDLILRTSGELRLSNFLTWQSVYSELYFTKTIWTDFSRQEFDKILEEYNNSKRRFGG